MQKARVQLCYAAVVPSWPFDVAVGEWRGVDSLGIPPIAVSLRSCGHPCTHRWPSCWGQWLSWLGKIGLAVGAGVGESLRVGGIQPLFL